MKPLDAGPQATSPQKTLLSLLISAKKPNEMTLMRTDPAMPRVRRPIIAATRRCRSPEC
jgi:hypothetical protein